MTNSPPASPSIEAPHTALAIAQAFQRAEYNEARVLKLLDAVELPSPRRRRLALPLYRYRARGDQPLAVLTRVFLLGEPVSPDLAREAFEPPALEDWAALGLVAIENDLVRANVEMSPLGDLVLAADWTARDRSDWYEVMPIAASSRTLANLTIRRPVKRTLDLGTGSGVLALLAAAHSEHVLATDRNPRAVAFTRFNAQFNAVANVTACESDLFDPIEEDAAGEGRFDLITCNPPFIIGPRARCMHSETGRPGDDFVRTIVEQAPGYLSEGGFCQIVCNWACETGRDWPARLRGWISGHGCDAWVMQFRTQDVAEYAADRIAEARQPASDGGSQFEGRHFDGNKYEGREFDEWMDWYARQQIDSIGFGLVTLRRQSGAANWFRSDAPQDVRGPCDDDILRGFEARDLLEAHPSDESLLELRFRPDPRLRWSQKWALAEGGWRLTQSQLRLFEGLGFAGNADRLVASFVERCQGGGRLRDLLKQSAREAGQRADRFTPDFLRVVRRLIELGFLIAEPG